MKIMKKPMDCSSAEEIMFEYLDGALTRTEASRLEDHISVCGNCKAELEERKIMLDTVKLTRVDPPAELKESVMLKIENIPQEKAVPRFIPSVRTVSALAVAACAVFAVAVGFRAFLSPGVTTGSAGKSANGELYSGDIYAVTTASARILDAHGDISVQNYSDTSVKTADIKVSVEVTEDVQGSAAEDELDKLCDLAAEAAEGNTGVVVGSAVPFLKIISDAEKSEIVLGGGTYDCYIVTENCSELVGRFMRGEFSTGEMWRANLPSDGEISEIRFIIVDMQ